jgi:beta-lactamase regulating signal transducer with metallopeptidase domain
MTSFVWLGLGNLALAAPLAVVAWLSGRYARRPALTHGLWVLVLLKLVTPPIELVRIGSAGAPPTMEQTAGERERAEPDGWELIAVAPDVVELQADDEASPQVAFAGPNAVDDRPSSIEQTPNGAAESTRAANADPTGALAPAIAPAVVSVPADANENEPIPAATLSAATFEKMLPWLMPAIGGLWIAGAFIYWARLLRGSLRFRRILADASPAPEAVRARVAQLAGELGVRPPRVTFVAGAVSPLLWVSGRRAVLVLPRTLFEQLEPQQQTTLLVHELAHWKRGDHWVRRLECLACGLYWWCPLVWWARASLRQAEEECCDAWVTATVPDSARAYALALVETVDFLAGARPLLPPLASGLGPFPSLQRRLTMIFRKGTPRRLSLAGLFGLVGLGGLLLTWSPAPMTAAAQEGERPDPDKKVIRNLPGEGAGFFAAFQEEGAPRKKEQQTERKKVDPTFDRLEESRNELRRLRDELRARQAQLEEMQRDLDRRAAEWQRQKAATGRSGQGEVGGPAKAAPAPRQPPVPVPGAPQAGPGFFPGGGGIGLPGATPPQPVPPLPARQPGGPGAPGGSEVERRIDNLERKLDMMLQELGNLRRDMVGRGGAGGFGGFPGGGGGGGAGFSGKTPGPGGPGGFGPPPGFNPAPGGAGAYPQGLPPGGGGPGAAPQPDPRPKAVNPPTAPRKERPKAEGGDEGPRPAEKAIRRPGADDPSVPTTPRRGAGADGEGGVEPVPVAPRRVEEPRRN